MAATKQSVVIICSGGMDSITALYLAISKNYAVSALGFNYGQLHLKEVQFAKWHCDKLQIDYQVLDLVGAAQIWQGKSALTSDQPVPHGHYNDDNMKQTVVPNRNMLMLSYAIAKAITIDASQVWFGAHAGDHTIYPDCRPEFIAAMDKVGSLCDWKPIRVIAPLQELNKGQIVKLGVQLGVDYSLTWTCYQGKDLACGKCGSCVERLEAFQQNGLIDKIKYQP